MITSHIHGSLSFSLFLQSSSWHLVLWEWNISDWRYILCVGGREREKKMWVAIYVDENSFIDPGDWAMCVIILHVTSSPTRVMHGWSKAAFRKQIKSIRKVIRHDLCTEQPLHAYCGILKSYVIRSWIRFLFVRLLNMFRLGVAD